MKVGDLVDINQQRGTGSYKHTIARGLGVVVLFEELEDYHFVHLLMRYLVEFLYTIIQM